MNRSGEAFEAAVGAEAQQLAALLDKNAPGAREAVRLLDGDPAALRAFWGAVGWNAQWPRRFRLHHPDPQTSARELPALLEQLTDESPDSPALVPGGLPRAFRLADVDRDGIGFVLTDEDDPQRRDDPAMKVVIFDTGEVSAVPTSYLSWCADELLGVAHAGWFGEFVKPDEIPAGGGSTPFPALSPTTRILAPDVWLMPADGYALPTDSRRVVFANADDFARLFGRPPKRGRR